MWTFNGLTGTHLHLLLHLHVISTFHRELLMLQLLHSAACLFWV
jgi:hypothetical protein